MITMPLYYHDTITKKNNMYDGKVLTTFFHYKINDIPVL